MHVVHPQLPHLLPPVRLKNRRVHQQNSLHPDRPERKKFLQRCQRRLRNRVVEPAEVHGGRGSGMDHDVFGKTDDRSLNHRSLLPDDHLHQQHQSQHHRTYLPAHRISAFIQLVLILAIVQFLQLVV